MGTRPYDFHKLHSETEFEGLVALVARKLIGRVIEFKQGPDEGRDARFDGKALDWPNENGLEGKFVLQAKHTLSETGDCKPHDFRKLVRGEYTKIRRLVEGGVCDYYLLFTTWQLPGAVDQELIREIEEDLGVAKAAIIARETLERIVDEHPEIQNWLYEHTEGSRARSTQRWGRLLALLREQDARTRNIIGFMSDAFVNANQAAKDLVAPQFKIIDSSERTAEVIEFTVLVERLGKSKTPVLVEGPVGAGKSTAAKMLVQARVPDGDQIADKYDQNNYWLPLYITGRDIQQSWDNFVNLLDRATNETDHRNWCVVVDGFDEIDNADLRVRLIDYACSNLHPKNAELGFVLFSRPGVADVPEGQRVSTLQVEGFDRARQLQTALLFSEGEQHAENLLASLEKSLADELLERPLFLALAFYLVTEGYSDLNSRYELLDFFVDDVLKRASAKSGYAEDDLLRELSELAVVTDHSMGPKRLRGVAAINAANKRRQAMAASGLVKRLKYSTQFTHEIFSHFFKARHLAKEFEPDRRVWEKVDPFHWGWETVSLLCECWDTRAHDLSECLVALSRLSSEGFERATELAATCENVSEQARCDFAVQIISAYDDVGVVAATARTLSRLGSASEQVRQFLEETAEFGFGKFSDARVLAAHCVARFDAHLGQDFLIEIALDDQVYCVERISAAQELNNLGVSSHAIQAFRKISLDGDTFEGRFDGAVSALELTGDVEDRTRLENVIAAHQPEDLAFDDTLGRAAKLGFSEFAIPLIYAPIEEALAGGVRTSHTWRLDLRSALRSCETLTSTGFGEDALKYYMQMIDLDEVGSRTMADILSSMEKAGFKQQVEDILLLPENLSKLRREPDWFTIEFLGVHNLAEQSVEDTLSSLKTSISDRHELHACLGYTDRLIANGRHDDVLQVLRSVPVQKLLPTHFEIQARCGERQLARESLIKGFRAWNTQDKIWSAEVLEGIGFGDDATQVLLTLAKNSDLLLDDRLDAALKACELDGRHLPTVKDCLEQARDDDLLYAQLTENLVRHGDVAAELAWRLISDNFSRDDLCDNCRFEFARVLQDTPAPIGFEEEKEELNDEIIGLLADVSDPWLFARCASAFSSTYASGYRNSIIVDCLKKDADLWSADLLRGVDYIEEITLPLEEEITNFSSSVRCDWPTTIHALQKLAEANPDGVAKAKLCEFILDEDVPLRWRLACMGIEWNQSRSDESELFRRASSSQKDWRNSSDSRALITGFCNDPTLTVECRLALIKKLNDEERPELLLRLAGESLECSDTTRIDLARDLARLSFEGEANQIVDGILAAETLGFREAEELLELCDELGRQDAVQNICARVSVTPDAVLVRLEETSSVRTLAVRIADVLSRDKALRVLRSLAEKNQFARWEDESIRAAFSVIGAPAELTRRTSWRDKPFLLPDGVHWGAMYDAALRVGKGNISDLPAFIEILDAVDAPLGAKTRALEVLFKAPSDHFSDKAFEAAFHEHLRTAIQSDTSVDDLFGLISLLIAVRKLSRIEEFLEPLLVAAMRPSETIKLSRLLDQMSRKELSRRKIEQLQTFDLFLSLEDYLYVQNVVGHDAAEEKLSNFLNSKEVNIFDRIVVASDVASSTGAKPALAFISEIENEKLDCSEFLRLAEHHYEMGHLGIARAMYSKALKAEGPDYYWLAEFALRYLGDKRQSGDILTSNLDKFEPTYFDQVGRILADLGLNAALETLEKMEADADIA